MKTSISSVALCEAKRLHVSYNVAKFIMIHFENDNYLIQWCSKTTKLQAQDHLFFQHQDHFF